MTRDIGQVETQKVCICCHADVTGQRYHKNRHGEYVCLPCHHAGREPADSSSQGQIQRRCACCGAEVARRDCHKNRYHEYVCLKCHEAGRRVSWRRTVVHGLRSCLTLGAYALAALVAFRVAYFVFARLVEIFLMPQ